MNDHSQEIELYPVHGTRIKSTEIGAVKIRLDEKVSGDWWWAAV
jgi:hypothetical protein